MLADAALVTAGTPFRPAGFIPAAGKPSSLVSSINRIGDKLGVLYPPGKSLDALGTHTGTHTVARTHALFVCFRLVAAMPCAVGCWKTLFLVREEWCVCCISFCLLQGACLTACCRNGSVNVLPLLLHSTHSFFAAALPPAAAALATPSPLPCYRPSLLAANPTATATSEMTEPAATTTNTTSDLPLEGPEAANTTTTTPQAEAAGVVSTATNITAATVLPAEVEANATTPAQPAADPATEEVPALTEQALPTPAAAKDIVDEQAAKPLRVVVPGSTTTSRVGRKLTAVTQGPVVPPTGGRTPNVHQRQTRLRREAPRARTNNARPGKN